MSGDPAGGPVLAVDVGGTKLAVALVDVSGRAYRVRRAPTPAGPRADAETIWAALDGLLDALLAEDGPPPEGVGVGCGGPMVWPAGEVSPLNIASWRDFPLRARMQHRFAGIPVRVHNDAVCLAVGEHWRGAGRGRDNMLGMVVSTGVGGGLVLGGRLVDGADGNAGHIGHVVVDPDGPECSCGGYGCLEAIAAGPRLAGWAQAQGWRPSAPAGDVATARDLADDARRGHPVAAAAMNRAGAALGVAIASATHLLNLEVVSIGGGLSQAGPLIFDPLQESLHRHARLSFAARVAVVPATLGQDAGLVGAAALVLAGSTYWNPAN
jgi:glucokinase